MSLEKPLTRRDALKHVALGALALPLLGGNSGCATAPTTPATTFAPDAEHGLRLGVAGYTFRKLTIVDSIAALNALRLVNVSVNKEQIDWENVTPDIARAAAEKFHAAGITLTGTNVIPLANDEAKCRRVFENVRAARIVTLLCKPDLEAVPLLEKLAKEFDQRVAIHNHGPEDKIYPRPQIAFDAVKSLDARMGVCLDIGHANRAQVDPVEAIRQFAPRLYDVHLKDSLAVPGALKDIPVAVGAGHVNIRGVLHALLKIGYRGVAAFEYEKDAANPVTGLAESVGYVRGLLAAGA